MKIDTATHALEFAYESLDWHTKRAAEIAASKPEASEQMAAIGLEVCGARDNVGRIWDALNSPDLPPAVREWLEGIE